MNKKETRYLFLYVFLFCAAFNDILRIGSTPFSFFRFLLPFATIFTVSFSKKARFVYVIFSLIAFCSIIQSLLFSVLFQDLMSFSIRRYMEYFFYYYCISVVICSVLCLYEQDSSRFFPNMEVFILLVAFFYFGVFCLISYFPRIINNYLYLSNVNDYSAVIVATIPFLILKQMKKAKFSWILISLIVSYFLLKNDCKLALIGLFLQFLIIGYYEIRNKVKEKLIYFLFVLSLMIIFILILLKSNLSINGYYLNDTLFEPIKRILKLDYYDTSDTSVTFRTNSFIASIRILLESFFLGIGIGNSGVVMKSILIKHGLSKAAYGFELISLHNVFFEMLIEFGLIALVFVLFVVKKILRIIKKRYLNISDLLFLTIIISSVFWLQAPSGILCEYQLFVIFSVVFISEEHFSHINN